MKSLPLLPALVWACLPVSSPRAEEMREEIAPPSEAEIAFFEKEIRPVLVQQCYECHATDSAKVKGGLLLDTRESTRKGGDSGPAVVPFHPEESLLLSAIRHEDLEMPPKQRLDESTVANFAEWIAMGAPDPRDTAARPGTISHEYTSTIDIEKGRAHWAYQAPQKPDLPSASPWARGAIDAFVAAKQREHGLTPAPDADAPTLLRRLTFDLTGLPPSPEEVAAFESEFAAHPDSAVAATVSRLLASPRYGERWGRHWLDVARYAESNGKEVNATLPQAWRYRDYVIDAFNDDKPFDAFLIEQIAGDLLPAANEAERAEHLVATGFLALGAKSLNERNPRQFRFDLVDEQIDTATQAFLGTTAACARCHDHKFDPIPMSDYYALAGIFLSSETLFGTAASQLNRRATDLIELPASAPTLPGISLADAIDLEYRRELLAETIAATRATAAAARRAGDGAAAQLASTRLIGLGTQLGLAEAELRLHHDDGSARPLALGMRDAAEPFDSQILLRGEEDMALEQRVPRGFLQVLQTGDEKPIAPDQSGRLQFAEWMASPTHPLTARVLANRVWLWLFGEGLVGSPDNFGTTGERPSHPELLDHLALRLVDLDWSVKDLIREIVASRTYRMASTFDAVAAEKDPENRYLWRARPRRLDAESLRDAVLAVSGGLDLSRPAGSVVAEVGVGVVGRTLPETLFEVESQNRSIYLPVVRGSLPEALGLFDFPDPSLPSGKREITTVPSQALYFMNSDFLAEASDAFATLLHGELGFRGADLLHEAFLRAYSRPPTPDEGAAAKSYLDRFLETAASEGRSEVERNSLALSALCQSLFASAEFRTLN